jgi:hypothetical protein
LNRWLLNTFTTWELGLIIIGGAVVIAVTAVYIFRRFARDPETNEITGIVLGVLAAIYGIVLAFVIVSLYDDFRKTKGDIRTEASAIAMVYHDTRGLDAPVADKLKEHIREYISTVRADEWMALAKGGESEKAWEEIDALYADLQNYTPTTVPQRVFYEEAVNRVNNLMAARRERLNDAEEGIPPTFSILLIVGALLLLVFPPLFMVRSFRLHVALAVSVALLIGFNLLLALVLDLPYSGQVAVSNAPFTQGALATFAQSK